MKTILIPNSNIPPAYSLIYKLHKDNYKIYCTKDRQNFQNFTDSKYEYLLQYIHQPKSEWLSGYIEIDPTKEIELYFKSILSLCQENEIKEILLVNDIDIFLLSRYKKEFKNYNIKLFCPDFETFINITHKFLGTRIASNYGLAIPKTFLYEKGKHNDYINLLKKNSLVVKAEYSNSSLYVWKISNEEEFNDVIKRLLFLQRQPIIQEYIESLTDYSFHYITNSSGEVTFGFTLEKLRHLKGSWSTSIKIIPNCKFYNDAKKMVEDFKQAGFWVIQGQKSIDNKIYFIEINARFGNNSRILFELFNISLPSYLILNYSTDKKVDTVPKITSNRGVSVLDDLLAFSQQIKKDQKLKDRIKTMKSFLISYLYLPKFDIYTKTFLLDRKYCTEYFTQIIKEYAKSSSINK